MPINALKFGNITLKMQFNYCFLLGPTVIKRDPMKQQESCKRKIANIIFYLGRGWGGSNNMQQFQKCNFIKKGKKNFIKFVQQLSILPQHMKIFIMDLH